MDRVHFRIGLIQTDISVGNVSSSSAIVYVAQMAKSFVCLGHIYGMHGTVDLNISGGVGPSLDPKKYLIRKYN